MTQKLLVQLGILGFFTIAGMVLMLKSGQQIDAQVLFAELSRAQTPIYLDFNPCQDVRCTPFGPAKLVGEDRSALTRLDQFGGNKICECPDGKQVLISPKITRRYS